MAGKRPNHELDVSEATHVPPCKNARVHAVVTSLSPVKVSPDKSWRSFIIIYTKVSESKKTLRLRAVFVLCHQVSANKKWKYFDAKVTDGKKTLRAVSFDPDQHR